MKVLGTKYGIEITRPWNPAMYEHNNKVSARMKEAISAALNRAYTDENEDDLRLIAKSLSGYGVAGSGDIDTVYEDACRQLDIVENWWLHGDVWPDMVKFGFVKDLKVKFVGYDK